MIAPIRIDVNVIKSIIFSRRKSSIIATREVINPRCNPTLDRTLIPDLNSLAFLVPQSSAILCRVRPFEREAPSPCSLSSPSAIDAIPSTPVQTPASVCLGRAAWAALIDWFQLISVSAAHFKTGLTGRAVPPLLDPLRRSSSPPPP